jgi:hypothetical protein
MYVYISEREWEDLSCGTEAPAMQYTSIYLQYIYIYVYISGREWEDLCCGAEASIYSIISISIFQEGNGRISAVEPRHLSTVLYLYLYFRKGTGGSPLWS